jgi:hypothetical protein
LTSTKENLSSKSSPLPSLETNPSMTFTDGDSTELEGKGNADGNMVNSTASYASPSVRDNASEDFPLLG